jgi:hypothetical protein
LFSCVCQKKVVPLHRKGFTINNRSIMATYSLKINERSTQGQALLAYLEALKVDIKKVPSVRVSKSSYERSMDDIKHGRIEKFASADEMCKSLGI